MNTWSHIIKDCRSQIFWLTLNLTLNSKPIKLNKHHSIKFCNYVLMVRTWCIIWFWFNIQGFLISGIFSSLYFSSSIPSADWQQMTNNVRAASLLGFRSSVTDAEVSETAFKKILFHLKLFLKDCSFEFHKLIIVGGTWMNFQRCWNS